MKALWTAVATLALGVVAVFGPGASAATVPLAGVNTTVTVTADLGGLGLTGAPFGTATVDETGADPVFAFPITGGTLDTGTGNALIEHNGSGVTLSDGTISATVGNFLIDTFAETVFGTLIDTSTGAAASSVLALFDFGTGSELLGVELLISETLAGELTRTFSAPDLSGETFGYAVPNVAAVPVPAAGVLLLGGLGLMGALRSRRKAA